MSTTILNQQIEKMRKYQRNKREILEKCWKFAASELETCFPDDNELQSDIMKGFLDWIAETYETIS